MSRRVLIVPGHGNSGTAHWQSIWEYSKPGYWRRMKVGDWDHAVCDEWVAAIARDAEALGPDVIIVAHSLGCLAVVHWAVRNTTAIGGALLVAVPDPSAPAFPRADSIGFSPVPSVRLPFPSIVVASDDDPYAAISYAQSCANSWGSEFLNVGARGHLNAASHLDDWAEGYRLLQRFDTSNL
ncbi:RBBP9/YdeN family alpha/beta hydrolase [Burkholderia alba]|uniref:RBBP9/YdeN family alpha/beta hydrolase n=1 Tax=Burkholderia alba TaxID=2683677 RepID=UPI002B05CF0B|nr:alpha/beta hydrolase [Burkholderia alba]